MYDLGHTYGVCCCRSSSKSLAVVEKKINFIETGLCASAHMAAEPWGIEELDNGKHTDVFCY